MTIKISRGDEPVDAKRITVIIDDDRYTLSESIDGRLLINKVSDGDSDSISVHPRYTNEIELS